MAYDEDMTTHQLKLSVWIEPVASARALPKKGVDEGVFCYVQEPGDEATWQYRRGRWTRLAKRGQ